MVTLYLLIVARLRNREKNVATLDKVAVDITVVLGTTSMPIHQVLRLRRGAIIELDSMEEDAVSILANNLPVANGTVVVNGNRIAVNVAELLPRPPAMRSPQQNQARGEGARALSLYILFVTWTAIIGTRVFEPFVLLPMSMMPKGGNRRTDQIVLDKMRPWRNW